MTNTSAPQQLRFARCAALLTAILAFGSCRLLQLPAVAEEAAKAVSVPESAAPPNVEEGKLTAEGDWRVAQSTAAIGWQLQAQKSLELGVRLGLKQAMTLVVTDSSGKMLKLLLQAVDGPGKSPDTGEALPDGAVSMQLTGPGGEKLLRDSYNVRPNSASYRGTERADLLARWNTLPAASRQPILLRVEAQSEVVGIWLQSRFVGTAALKGALTVRLQLSAGSSFSLPQIAPLLADRNRYVPIDLRGYAGHDAGAVNLPYPRGGMQTIGGVPFRIAEAGTTLDVGRSRWLAESTGFVGIEEFGDPDMSRNAFDSAPENIVLAVPTDDYSVAHLLLAVDPDPHKAPVLTLMLTRFTNSGGDSGGRGDALADSSVRLVQTNGKWPPGVRQLGVARGRDKAGNATQMPVLSVDIALRTGAIEDVIDETGTYVGRSTQHLDLELTKARQLVRTRNYSVMTYKPLGDPSAALVYGLTLERAPVKVRLKQRQVGNVFYKAEKPGFRVELQNRTGRVFRGKINAQLTDYYGKSTAMAQDVELAAGSAPVDIALNLSVVDLGWLAAHINLVESGGRVVWQTASALAVLAPDTRRAGPESPYGTWWFRKSHGGTDSIDEVGPLFKRMGFRHTMRAGDGKPGGAELSRYGLSISQIPYYGGNLDKALANFDAAVVDNPGTKYALVFHESGYGGPNLGFPPEFIGKSVPPLDEKTAARYQTATQRSIAYSRHIREKYPDIKLVVGNGGLGFAAGLMQNGYPKELVDAWGDEELGQANLPEAPPTSTQGTLYWNARYAEKYGYAAPMTTTFEWHGRGTNPGNLSEFEQACYYSRDVLRALAYRTASINPGIIHDVGDAYFYSRWGSGGFTHRYPLLTPKISYVAMAVLTQQLDRAHFERVLDTDSPTLHALEFTQDGNWVYALWVPRGEKTVTLSLADDTPANVTDMDGRTVRLAVQAQRARITVGEAPLYLRLASKLAGLSSGATQLAAVMSVPNAVAKSQDVAHWLADAAADTILESAHFDFPRQQGAITARAVTDAVKGDCLELGLAAQPAVPWPVGRYITVRPPQPVVLPGRPQAVGVWVRGNSSWSRIFFELQDAKGETFRSIGAVDGGYNLADWKCLNYLDFDGWGYISAPLPQRFSSGFYAPQEGIWRSEGGDGIVDFPVKVTALTVVMRDKVVQVNRVVDVPHSGIRLAGLGAIPVQVAP